jgi:hypothetical protein
MILGFGTCRQLALAASVPANALEAELSQVMIKMEVGMAHALNPGELSKHGVGSEFAFQGTKALKQNAEVCKVGCKALRRRPAMLLVHFRTRLEAVRPRQWDPERERLQDHTQKNSVRRTDVLFTECRSQRIAKMADHLVGSHCSPSALRIRPQLGQTVKYFVSIVRIQ